MDITSESKSTLPPRVAAALHFLDHCRSVTSQHDVTIPPRELTALETRVHACALRALQSYFLGEMDYIDPPPEPPTPPPAADDGNSPTPVPTGPRA